MTDQNPNEDKAFQAFDNQPQPDPRIDNLIKENEELKGRLDRFTQAITGESNAPWRGKDKTGRPAPTGWDEVDERLRQERELAKEEAKKEVLSEVEKREQERLKKQEEEQKRTQEQQKQQMAQFDKDWYDLVEEGKMPAMSEESQTKLKEGKLTEQDALKDPALKARMELIQVAREKGENSLYKAFHKHFSRDRQKNAPVFGASTSGGYSPEETSYEEIHKKALNLVG